MGAYGPPLFLQGVLEPVSYTHLDVYKRQALGYTMVYGIARMLNFAHGDVIMVGGYVAFVMMTSLGLPALAAILSLIHI